MSDRSSAYIFGSVFAYLAETPDDRSKAFAVKMWRLKNEIGADFSDYQMDVDDALITLGLACRGVDEYSDAAVFYAGEDRGPVLPK